MSKYIEEKVNLLKKEGYIIHTLKDGMGNPFPAVKCGRHCDACPYVLGHNGETYCAVEAFGNENYGCYESIDVEEED